jgi:hypothetical protein
VKNLTTRKIRVQNRSDRLLRSILKARDATTLDLKPVRSLPAGIALRVRLLRVRTYRVLGILSPRRDLLSGGSLLQSISDVTIMSNVDNVTLGRVQIYS